MADFGPPTNPATVRVVYDDDQDRHLVMYTYVTKSAWYGYVVAGDIDGAGVITYGTAVSFNAGEYGIGMAYSTSDNKFLCLYNNSGTLYAFTVSLSGSVITKSSDTSVSTAHADITVEVVYDTNADKFLAIYRKTSGEVVSNVIDISSGISVGSETAISGATWRYGRGAYSTVDQKILVVYTDQTNMRGRVATISGSTVSYGTEIVMSSDVWVTWDVCYDSNADKFAIAARANSTTRVDCILCEIVAGDPSVVGSPVEVVNIESEESRCLFDTINKAIYVGYSRGSGSAGDGMYAIVGKIAGSSISFPTSNLVTINTDNVGRFGMTFDPIATKVIVSHSNSTESAGYTNHIDVDGYSAAGAGGQDDPGVLSSTGYTAFDMLSGVNCHCLDVSTGVWLVAGHRCNAINNVYTTDTLDDDNQPKLRDTADYTITLAHSYAGGFDGKIAIITFTTDLPAVTDSVWCNVEGMWDSGLIENPIEMMEHFLINYMGFTSAEYNTTTFGTAETTATSRSYVAAGTVELASDLTGRQIIEGMARSFGLTVAYDNDGKLTIKFLG